MSFRFAYFYLLSGDTDRVPAVAPSHTRHWQGLHLSEYRGGPFSDRTGGLITFVVDDARAAQAAVAADPFVRENLIERSWLRQWELVGSDG